jgi:hypothetical protein
MKNKKPVIAISIGKGRMPPPPGMGEPPGNEEKEKALEDAVARIMEANVGGSSQTLKAALDDWHTIMHS